MGYLDPAVYGQRRQRGRRTLAQTAMLHIDSTLATAFTQGGLLVPERGLTWQTATSAGAASGQFLVLTVDGTTYKVRLLDAS